MRCLLAEVLKFPQGEMGGGYKQFYVFAAIVGIILPIATGTITGSVMLGRASAQIESLGRELDQDHKETKGQINSLTSNVSSVSIQASSLAAQVESLRQLLVQERSDRLESERNIILRFNRQ